jgi:hypothetical protein
MIGELFILRSGQTQMFNKVTMQESSRSGNINHLETGLKSVQSGSQSLARQFGAVLFCKEV